MVTGRVYEMTQLAKHAAGDLEDDAYAIQAKRRIIMCDMERAESLGSPGNPIVRTPHLDGLAQEGVRFPNAFAQAPSCVPSARVANGPAGRLARTGNGTMPPSCPPSIGSGV